MSGSAARVPDERAADGVLNEPAAQAAGAASDRRAQADGNRGEDTQGLRDRGELCLPREPQLGGYGSADRRSAGKGGAALFRSAGISDHAARENLPSHNMPA